MGLKICGYASAVVHPAPDAVYASFNREYYNWEAACFDRLVFPVLKCIVVYFSGQGTRSRNNFFYQGTYWSCS